MKKYSYRQRAKLQFSCNILKILFLPVRFFFFYINRRQRKKLQTFWKACQKITMKIVVKCSDWSQQLVKIAKTALQTTFDNKINIFF